MDAKELREQYPDAVHEIEQQAVEEYVKAARTELSNFSFFRTYWLAAMAMPKSIQADFVMGIVTYAFTGVVPNLKQPAMSAFIAARPNIDNSVDAVLFGKRGGRPRNRRTDDGGSKKHDDEVKQVVSYLNSKAGKSFRATAADTKRHIEARLNEGYSVDDCKRVVDNMVAAWGPDDKMSKYLRPATLFGTKFDGYLNAGDPDRGGDYGQYR